MAPSASTSKLLLKRYYYNNSDICGYSEETNAPNSPLKTCFRCEPVKYCSKDCEIQKRPEHHVVCKDYLFEKACEFFRLSFNYKKTEQRSSEMLETVAKTFGYQLTLSYGGNKE